MKIKLVLAILAVGGMLTFAACNQSKTDQKAVPTDSTKVVAAAGKYTCPMHPEVVQDSIGKCPKCGMDLEMVTNKQDSTKK